MMVIANELNSLTRESFVIETTETFTKDLNKLTDLQQKQVTSKLQRIIETAIQNNDPGYLLKRFKKIRVITLSEYKSSLHLLNVNPDFIIFLFYEDDPIFSSIVITLLRVCFHRDMNKVLKNLCESFYQKKLTYLGEFDDER